MIGKVGTTVQVLVFASLADRDAGRDGILQPVTITSAGPPGVVADWGLATGTREWLLVRKPKVAGGHKWEAVRGDKGESG